MRETRVIVVPLCVVCVIYTHAVCNDRVDLLARSLVRPSLRPGYTLEKAQARYEIRENRSARCYTRDEGKHSRGRSRGGRNKRRENASDLNSPASAILVDYFDILFAFHYTRIVDDAMKNDLNRFTTLSLNFVII